MAAERKALLGENARRIQPKLRMFANASTEVNILRAEHCCSIAAAAGPLEQKIRLQRGEGAVPLLKEEARRPLVRGSLKETSNDVLASVFVQTGPRPRTEEPLRGETARRANLSTAEVRLSDLKGIADRPDVYSVELGESLRDPRPIVSSDPVSAPDPRRFGSPDRHHGGEGVLIGIIDVEGFDFAHPDFQGTEGTRWLRIWDQGATAPRRPGDKPPFGYGAEVTKKDLDAAIQAAPRLGVPPQRLEPQSQMVAGSHGTHVASIAAGKTGVCPNAWIAGVLVSVPESELERRRSFYDSTRIAHAVDYLTGLADELGLPVSINLSLGTNGHAHDSSAAVNRWIDSALSVSGRCVSVAAGNAGQEAAAFEGDLGFVTGRIHTSGRIAARGLTADIEWLVVGNGIADLSENELEIWYGPQDRFSVSVRPPGGEWTRPIAPGEFIENQELPNGSFLSLYNETYHPANGANSIAIYLTPFLSDGTIVGVLAGEWLVRLHGLDVRDGRYHGWIERDDPRRLGRVGPKEAWSFPSFFSSRSNVDNSSVSTLACGERVLSVANLDASRDRIHGTSSQGPTRDGRCKPDVAAPGTDIVAAKGFAGPEDLWVKMTGTSMASPFVAGVAGLMLAVEPRLTAAQIGGILHRTVVPLPGATFAWSDGAGFGRIDPEGCLREAERGMAREDRTT